MPRNAFQRRHNNGLLLGKALELSLQRCSALNVKAIFQRLQRQSVR